MKWLDKFTDKEPIFAAMRDIGAKADALMAEHNKLRPDNAHVAVGGAHMDPFIKAEALMALLRAIRNGATPIDAMKAAKEEARLCVKNWNAKREWQVHLWEGMADAMIETYWRKLNAFDVVPSDDRGENHYLKPLVDV